MFEDVVSSLLSTYLGDYLEGLSKKDLKFLCGKVMLNCRISLYLNLHFIYRE